MLKWLIMTDKVRTAFYGKDLRVEIKNYPLNTAGDRIEVVSGGEHHFMPNISPNSFLEMPIRKKYLFFGKTIYARTFFAVRRAKACIDFFPEGMVYGPDPEELKKANAVSLAKKIGTKKQEGIPWYVPLIILSQFAIIGLLLQIGGFFH